MTTEGILSGHPDWFHPYGASMMVKKQGSKFVILASDTASLKISLRCNRWVIEWTIDYNDAVANGATAMTQEELGAAFGLSNYSSTISAWMLRKWQADCASEGRFIRHRVWLNVPGPGTGQEGDPNVSVVLTVEIQQAVDSLLNRNKRRPIFLKIGFQTFVSNKHAVIA